MVPLGAVMQIYWLKAYSARAEGGTVGEGVLEGEARGENGVQEMPCAP